MRNVALVSLLCLAACNNGGGAPTPTPTPVNTAPVFTSATAASIVENLTAAYQAAATDANGDAITFSIAGGADAARFSITAAGALTFTSAPNFDLPGDANRDNVYEVQLRASDGTLSSTLDLQVTVTNSVEGIRVRRTNHGYLGPYFFAPDLSNSSRYFVGELGGSVFLASQTSASTGGDLNGPYGGSGAGNEEMGQLAVAGPPDYATSRKILVHRTRTDFASEIVEFDTNTRAQRTLLILPHQPSTPNNYAGWMAFGPDGYLYIATGYGGGVADSDNNAQNPNSLLGKILRVRVDRSTGTTTLQPAPGNPFIGGGGHPFVFALGLQNPRRASFDGNRLIIVDVGQNSADEINLMPLDQPGINFGWPYLEGTTPIKGTPPAGLTAPVMLYPHSAGPRRANSIVGSMVGGFVYRGPIASLQGHYVFADYLFGDVYSFPVSSLVQGRILPFTSVERRTQDFRPTGGWTLTGVSSFGMDGNGNLYLLDFYPNTDGEVFVVEPQ